MKLAHERQPVWISEAGMMRICEMGSGESDQRIQALIGI